MVLSQVNPGDMGALGISSGTTAYTRCGSKEAPVLIAIENILMINTLTLQAAPRRVVRGAARGPQPAVLASLERSLKQNAEIWAELSKY